VREYGEIGRMWIGGTPMAERLTKDEIYARFPDEWILLKDPEVGPVDEVLGGTLLYHTTDRDEIYQVVTNHRPGNFAIFYTGPACDYPVVL
jgi:hypothetical protein